MTMSNHSFKTPAAKKKEDYEDYDLSPPKMPEKERLTFNEAVGAIKRDFKGELRVEWKEGKVTWLKKRVNDGTEVELPSDFRRILLFLYSRNFKKHVNMKDRRTAVQTMLRPGRIRKVILQVIGSNGDTSLSFDETYRAHYIRACLTVHRYFQQTGAVGFLPDMSSLTYYLRMQKFGSCFLQAPCVAMSYLLHAHGKPVPPPDTSRLIRHHFGDEQLIKYIVQDYGGDSVGIFKILEELFFVCQQRNRDPDCIFLGKKSRVNIATELLEDGPGLVSKFTVPHNFECSPPSNDLKEKWPDLAHYENWDEIPANLIPPGVARFTTWDEPAEFIPLNGPSDEGLKEKEDVLKGTWKTLLLRSAEEDERSTAVTTSLSADSSTSTVLAENAGSQGTLGERSPSDNAPMFNFMDDDSDGEDWSHFFNDDDDSDSSALSHEDHEPGEGAAETPLHAMVLLGHRMVAGSRYWVLQNSWEGPMQIIEVSTEYLIESGAYLYFYPRESRSPKPEAQWSHEGSSFFCPSPVAESSGLERSDCEKWTDDLVRSMPQPTQASEIDDIFTW